MPSEQALCEGFSVSRTVVREAVKMLQEKGLVRVRRGSGTTVTPPVLWNMLDEFVLAASIAEANGLEVLDDVVVTRRLLESDMANVAARQPRTKRSCASCSAWSPPWTRSWTTRWRTPSRTAPSTTRSCEPPATRSPDGVVKALEKQVVNTARYVGEIRRDLCVASNNGHRNVYLRIAAHDPEGAAKAMFTHITEAWVVRRGGPGEPVRLRR